MSGYPIDPYKYDVCLSFAGEDRGYVNDVAEELKKREVRVFYDKYEEVELWGKDLYEHLNDIYKNRAKFCVMFVSRHYASKLWTTHERQSAQERAFKDNSEYILPARFDETPIPGLRETVAYIDLRGRAPDGFAKLVCMKLESTRSAGSVPQETPLPPKNTALAHETPQVSLNVPHQPDSIAHDSYDNKLSDADKPNKILVCLYGHEKLSILSVSKRTVIDFSLAKYHLEKLQEKKMVKRVDVGPEKDEPQGYMLPGYQIEQPGIEHLSDSRLI